MDNQPEHPWRWCLVGNITDAHEFGESGEIRMGTKHFQPGAKVYLAPPNWGDGYEMVVAIGCPRKRKRYIEIIIRSDHVGNFRLKKVYSPFLLEMMDKSTHYWWGNTDTDRENIETLIDSINRSRETGTSEGAPND